MTRAVAQLVYSARERSPAVVPTARQISDLLSARGAGGDAGWLLLAMVAPELVRPGRLEAPTRALARDAAELLAVAGETMAAAEIYLALEDRARATALLRRAGRSELAAQLTETEDSPKVLVQRGLDGGPLIASFQVVRDRLAAALARLDADAVEPERMLALSEVLGLDQQAAELAAGLGRYEQAADAWVRHGDRIAAAKAYHQAGASHKALEALVRVERDHPAYRQACVFGIRLATHLGQLDYELYHLLRAFLKEGPWNKSESKALQQLADLFDSNGQPVPADEIRQALAGRPVTRSTAVADDLSALPSLPPPPVQRTQEVFAPLSDGADAPADAGTAKDALRGQPASPFTLRPLRDETPSVSDRSVSSEGSDTHGDALVGTVISGRYYIEARLGRGGHGIVYRAKDLTLSEQVALKFIRGLGTDRRAVQRFKQELSLARRLAHPNIVRVLGLGEDRDTLFISMELLHGLSLHEMPRTELTLPRVVDIIGQAAEGLSVAHELGVIHRDVSLDNLFQTQRGVLKIMDFGLARTVDGDAAAADDGGDAAADDGVARVVAGTPATMAPERIERGQPVTPAADQYSLGVVAYQLLTGRSPFQHADPSRVLRMHLVTAAAPPSSVAPAVPRALDAIVLRAMAKDPADRFESCRAFADALYEAAGLARPRSTA